MPTQRRILRNCLFSVLGMLCILNGCSTTTKTSEKPVPGAGFVDIYTVPDVPGLAWDVQRYDPNKKRHILVYSEVQATSTGRLRVTLPVGHHDLRVAFLNRVLLRPAEVEIEVMEGKVTPVKLTLEGSGT